MRHFKTIGWACCGIVIAILPTLTLAFQASDIATLTLHLTPAWKQTRTQHNQTITVTEYMKNALSDNRETLLITQLKKPTSHHDTDPIVKSLYLSTKKLMQKNHCTFKDITNIPQLAGQQNEWGVFWQCPPNNRSGFMFFIDSDPTTLYTLTYEADNAYPITPDRQKQMTELLQATELCYHGKACGHLLK